MHKHVTFIDSRLAVVKNFIASYLKAKNQVRLVKKNNSKKVKNNIERTVNVKN